MKKPIKSTKLTPTTKKGSGGIGSRVIPKDKDVMGMHDGETFK
jgi:hypothetical protein